MRVSFTWPTTHHRGGGVFVLYEFADALARRGHEVHFIHGPAWHERIETIEEIWHPFEPAVQHHIADDLDDRRLPAADVCFSTGSPSRLGLPAAFIQGFRMLPIELERLAFRAPSPKVCVARWLQDVGADFGVPPEQLWHIPVGLDHELFADRTPTDLRRYDVALWANPHPTKAWPVGWEAVEAARQEVPGLRVAVFAATPDPSLDLPPDVTLLVGLDRRQLADDVFNQTRVYVQPAFREGFGYTAVEAMACGAALVTTRNGGSADYAVDGETARVVPPGDVEAMAAAIVDLVQDESGRRAITVAGERSIRHFDWDEAGGRLEKHLLEYLDDPVRFQAESGPEAPVMRW